MVTWSKGMLMGFWSISVAHQSMVGSKGFWADAKANAVVARAFFIFGNELGKVILWEVCSDVKLLVADVER